VPSSSASPLTASSLHALHKTAVTAVTSELYEQADAGNSTAMCLLGCIVGQGLGSQGKRKDEVLAFRCFLSAAQQGNVDAQYNLGVCYATGCGVRQDQVKATRWFRAAAGAGDTEALRVVAIRMIEGKGCATASDAATTTFVRAAEAGDCTSEFNLGVRYAQGHGIPAQTAAGPQEFFMGGGKGWGGTKSTEPANAGNPWDGFTHFEDERNPAHTRIAVEWYKRAASKGHCKAMYNLAQLMAAGAGIPLSQDCATDLLRQAARGGYARAQYALALSLARDAASLRSVCSATTTAPPGSAEASSTKGAAGEAARGKTREEEAVGLEMESRVWLNASAESGYGKALYALGLQHAEGRSGAARNLTAATDLFLQAHEARVEGAWERYRDCNTSLAWEREPERLRKERRAVIEQLRKRYRQQQEAEAAIRTMFFPFAQDQEASRKLIAATLAQVQSA
jgi:TPR repeat protein